MGFGENVSALLETYDNCLSLLKAFKRQKKQDGGRRASRANEQQALLKHSLKTDRRKVERAYSSRLSEAGGRFEQGDCEETPSNLDLVRVNLRLNLLVAKAKSALSKVLKRLNAVIAGLIRVASRSSNPAMDYQSLMSLSNSSRIQAIKAFDSLSHRLDSKSSLSSVASASTSKSSRPSKSSKSSKPSKTKKSPGSKASRSGTSSTSKEGKIKKKSKAAEPNDHHDTQIVKVGVKRQDRAPLPPRLETSVQTPLLDSMERRQEDSLLRRRPSRMDRFSLISISSGSTKLGEIPERKWLRGHDDWDGRSDEYNTPIVYPLRPYGPPPVVKERRFLGIFRRGN